MLAKQGEILGKQTALFTKLSEQIGAQQEIGIIGDIKRLTALLHGGSPKKDKSEQD